MFLHKAIKPVRVFVNRILALLRKMSAGAKTAIDEGTKCDLQWFIACAHAVNGTIKIYKCVLPCIDTSLTGLGGGVFNNYVYELPILHKPEYCIAHWEAINVLVALRTFSSFISYHNVTVWCDNTVAVSILTSARGCDPILQSVARNMWCFEASIDCSIPFKHISGASNIPFV
jgi:hypothetical protein